MTMASTTRLASLDVLRGFDMLFIMGGGRVGKFVLDCGIPLSEIERFRSIMLE